MLSYYDSSYSGNGVERDDVNKCDDSSSCLDKNSKCENNDGALKYPCLVTNECVHDGYSDVDGICVDNECLVADSCNDNTRCANTNDSYKCFHESGFIKNDSSTLDGAANIKCDNKNKCLSDNECSANANCKNTERSYSCACDDGCNGNGYKCHDDNKCELSNHNCDINARCSNIDGSFTCSCNSGFNGDGVTYDDVDECENLHVTEMPLVKILLDLIRALVTMVSK